MITHAPLSQRSAFRFLPGQIAIILTLVIATLIAVIGLGTDLAVLYFNWGQLQKAADTAAIAGVNYLPSQTATASNIAISYAKKNGMQASEIDTPIVSASNTQLTLSLHRTIPYTFLRLLGLTNGQVRVSATASGELPAKTIGAGGGASSNPRCGNSTGQYDVLPIAVDNKTAAQYAKGNSYTLNRGDSSKSNGAWVDAPGSWGMVALCGGNGSGATLRASIANGFYGPISINQRILTSNGAETGPLVQGFADRMGASPDNPTSYPPTDPRAAIVPMADFKNCKGSCTLTVSGFLAFYVDSYTSGAIKGHFIEKVAEDAIGDPSVTTNAGVQGGPVLIK